MCNEIQGDIRRGKKVRIIKGLLVLLHYLFLTSLHEGGNYQIRVFEASVFPTLKSDRQIKIKKNLHLK